MARTQALDFEQRREKILAAAADLIAKNGFLGASLADITSACNMSKSLIFHYFTSKEDILFELMWGHVSELVQLANSIASMDRTSDEHLRLLARFLLQAYNGAQARQRILLSELDNLPPERRAIIVQAQREVIAVVDKFVARQSSALRNTPKQRKPYVMMYFAMLNWTHTWFDRNGPVSEQKVAEIASNMFLRGLP
jgi:AcrR family transcriptional regulator